MPDCAPAELTIYIPGGKKHAKNRKRLRIAVTKHYDNIIEDQEARAVLHHGGSLKIRDNDASWGVVHPIDKLRKTKTFADVDYDHVTSPTNYITGRTEYRRARNTTTFGRSEDRIVLFKEDVERLIGDVPAEEVASRILAAFTIPPPSYEVPKREAEADYG